MEENRFEAVAGEAQQHGYMPVEIAQQKALQRKQPLRSLSAKISGLHLLSKIRPIQQIWSYQWSTYESKWLGQW